MHIHTSKKQENKSPSDANELALKKSADKATFHFVDNRPESIAQRKFQTLVDNRSHKNVIQRYTDRKVISPSKLPAAKFLFEKRKDQGTATTGAHNYAVVLGSWDWDRSASNGHAELKLLTRWKLNEFGNEIQIVSEFKPCPDCQTDIKRFEEEHGVTVKVHYLIDYEGRGDGDKDAVRELYKNANWLDGGGEFVYRVIV